MSLQRHRLPPECVAYIQRCRYDAWLWLPPQDPAAKPPPNWRPLWLALHCAAARFARLRFVPRQPNPQRKEQHQENSHSSLPASFSPYSSLIKSTKPVSEMLARRASLLLIPEAPNQIYAACLVLREALPKGPSYDSRQAGSDTQQLLYHHDILPFSDRTLSYLSMVNACRPLRMHS